MRRAVPSVESSTVNKIPEKIPTQREEELKALAEPEEELEEEVAQPEETVEEEVAEPKFNLANGYYYCNKCPKRCKTLGNFNLHLRIHDDVKPFECPTCQATYQHSSTLVTHMRVHTGDRPYICGFQNCPKAYKHRSCLIEHRAAKGHHNE